MNSPPLLLRHLHVDLVRPRQTKLEARPLLDRLVARLEIAHFGLEAGVALLQTQVLGAPFMQLSIRLPKRATSRPYPTPERVLQQHDECEKDQD